MLNMIVLVLQNIFLSSTIRLEAYFFKKDSKATESAASCQAFWAWVAELVFLYSSQSFTEESKQCYNVRSVCLSCV